MQWNLYVNVRGGNEIPFYLQPISGKWLTVKSFIDAYGMFEKYGLPKHVSFDGSDISVAILEHMIETFGTYQPPFYNVHSGSTRKHIESLFDKWLTNVEPWRRNYK